VKLAQHTIVDIDLTDKTRLSDVRLWLKRRPNGGKVIFIVDAGARRDAVQAYSIGATDLVERPFDRKLLLAKLLSDIPSLADDLAIYPDVGSAGVAPGVEALQSIFDAVVSGGTFELKTVYAAGETLVASIEAAG
jgi:hypothetical protein